MIDFSEEKELAEQKRQHEDDEQKNILGLLSWPIEKAREKAVQMKQAWLQEHASKEDADLKAKACQNVIIGDYMKVVDIDGEETMVTAIGILVHGTPVYELVGNRDKDPEGYPLVDSVAVLREKLQNIRKQEFYRLKREKMEGKA